jgi:hypothetical protein
MFFFLHNINTLSPLYQPSTEPKEFNQSTRRLEYTQKFACFTIIANASGLGDTKKYFHPLDKKS